MECVIVHLQLHGQPAVVGEFEVDWHLSLERGIAGVFILESCFSPW